MKTISFINHKGGAGKTTLCINVAEAIHNDGCKIMVADADPQATLRDWQESGAGFSFDVLAADKRQTLNTVCRLAQQNDVAYLLIDTPGKLMDMSAHVISLSDFIVVPLSPSPCDVWATLDTLSIIRAGMRANPLLKTLIVLNQAIPNCTITNQVRELLFEHASDFRIAEPPIIGRISYAKSGMQGLTVFDTKDAQAMLEINLLTNEIINYLNEEINKNENP